MWYIGMVESPFEASATGRAMAKGRSLSQFQEMFPDEASCAAFLSKRRWSGGFACPRCGGRRMAALNRQTRQSSKGRPDDQASAASAQDGERNAKGSRAASPRPPP